MKAWLRPPLADAPPRPLTPDAVRVLGDVVEALLEDLAPPEPYVETLVRAAESQRGVAVVLEGLAARVDAAARRRHGQAFTACTDDQRRALLPAPPLQQGAWLRRQWQSGRDRVLRPHDALAYKHAVQPVLRQFARTDAWTVVGYDSHPGVPRGLTADDAAVTT